MSQNKKILIVSYYFPPNNSIAGRRWAKFAKELHKQGHDIRVLTFYNYKDRESNWEKDIASYQDKIIKGEEPFSNPFNYEYTFWHKIKYKLAEKFPKIFVNGKIYKKTWLQRLKARLVKSFVKGAYTDKTVFLKRVIHKHTEQAIKDGYNNVIVTCPPYKQGYYVSQLIKKFPKVNFIADFRDPWLQDMSEAHFSVFSKKRIDFEKKAELAVVSKFNTITLVSQKMKDYFVETYNVNSEKIKVIPNGFDIDDFSNSDQGFKFNSEKISLIYTGTFYDGALYLLEELVSVIKSSKSLKEKIEIHFAGNISNKTKELIDQNSNILFYHGIVKQSVVHAMIKNTNFCAVFLADNRNYALITKFYEYIALKKRIIVFSKGGYAGDFVEQKNIGFNAKSGFMKQALERLLDVYNQGCPPYDFDANEFSLPALTTEYEKLLI